MNKRVHQTSNNILQTSNIMMDKDSREQQQQKQQHLQQEQEQEQDQQKQKQRPLNLKDHRTKSGKGTLLLKRKSDCDDNDLSFRNESNRQQLVIQEEEASKTYGKSIKNPEKRPKKGASESVLRKRAQEKKKRNQFNEEMQKLSEIVFQINSSIVSGRNDIMGFDQSKTITVTNQAELLNTAIEEIKRLNNETDMNGIIIEQLEKKLAEESTKKDFFMTSQQASVGRSVATAPPGISNRAAAHYHAFQNPGINQNYALSSLFPVDGIHGSNVPSPSTILTANTALNSQSIFEQLNSLLSPSTVNPSSLNFPNLPNSTLPMVNIQHHLTNNDYIGEQDDDDQTNIWKN